MTDPSLYRRAYPSAARLSHWTAPDGWALRRFDWPARGAARGSILFQGGRGDIIEKYLESFAHWQARGWSITAFDWRGQGGSGRLSADPHVGHATDFGVYVADLAGFWADWSGTAPGPHIVFGHSMGGHLILRALTEGRIAPAAAVLVAPMLGLHAPFGRTRLAERVAGLLRRLGDPARAAWRDNELPDRILGAKSSRQALLTHDTARYADETFWQRAHPELTLGPPSWAWVGAAFASTRALRADPRLRALATLILALIADADRLVDAQAAVATLGQVPDARIVRFGAESAHEILREVDPVRQRALGEIDRFLAAHAAKPA